MVLTMRNGLSRISRCAEERDDDMVLGPILNLDIILIRNLKYYVLQLLL